MAREINRYNRNTWCVTAVPVLPESLSQYETVRHGSFSFSRMTDGRFMRDRCFESTDRGFLLLDGVILNKSELVGSESGAAALATWVSDGIDAIGLPESIGTLRGPFSGAWLDARTQVLSVFGNQTGETAVYVHESGLAASNSFDLLMRVARDLELPVSFDERAAMMMLSYGFMVDDTTFATEIKRVLPGEYRSLGAEVSWHQGRRRYWALGNSPDSSLDTADSLEELNRLFMKSVKRAVDKDFEYGYSDHLADLSGGVDTRVLNIAMKACGAKSITNMTYSQSGSPDHVIALRVAEELGNICLHLSLDGGKCLEDPLPVMRMNGGSAYYGGITGALPMLERLNFQRFGLEHTAMQGGAVVGSYVRDPDYAEADPSAGRISSTTFFPGLVDASTWANEEMFLTETRGFLGMTSTYLTRNRFTFATSPFLDVDLLEFAFAIPLEKRVGRGFYERWVRTFYPEALAVISTRDISEPGRTPWGKVKSTAWKLTRGPLRLQGILNRHFGPDRTVPLARFGGMNPEEVWYAGNPRLRMLVSEALENFGRLRVDPKLTRAMAQSLSTASPVRDKLMALSVAAIYDFYFSDAWDPSAV